MRLCQNVSAKFFRENEVGQYLSFFFHQNEMGENVSKSIRHFFGKSEESKT